VNTNLLLLCLVLPYFTSENEYVVARDAERMKAQLLKPEVRDRIKYLSSEQFGVDEKKRPGVDDVPQASFRKLNID